jgi:hypothetical protein
MNVTPTAGIAAAWSATKPNPNDQAIRAALERQGAGPVSSDSPAESDQGPPAPEGQGIEVDIRV